MIILKVRLLSGQERLTLNISALPDQSLRSIFEIIAVKRGINQKPELYQFHEYKPNADNKDDVFTIISLALDRQVAYI